MANIKYIDYGGEIHMSIFLDLRTSQGTRSGAVSNTATSPDYVAGIGLQVDTGTDIRVDLEATFGVKAGSDDTTFTATVNRYTDAANITTFSLGTPVFTQKFLLEQSGDTSAFSLSAADIVATAPASKQLSYALYISADKSGSTYQGQQNLIGTANAD